MNLGQGPYVTRVVVRDRAGGTTRRVELDPAGEPVESGGLLAEISRDGRFVGFWSFAGNLVANDANGQADAFARDRKAGTTTIASVATGGAPGDGESFGSYVSGDGDIVVFQSSSTNLVPGDTNGRIDVFVPDVRAGTTERSSPVADGGQTDADSFPTGISADGRHILLYSEATNSVRGDTNRAPDVFARGRVTGRRTRASVGASGAQANGPIGLAALSADGGTVAFESEAKNLVPRDANGAYDSFARTLGSSTAP